MPVPFRVVLGPGECRPGPAWCARPPNGTTTTFPEQVSESWDRAIAIPQLAPLRPGHLRPPREVVCENVPARAWVGPAPDAAQCRRAECGQHRTRDAAGCRKRHALLIIRPAGAPEPRGLSRTV